MKKIILETYLGKLQENDSVTVNPPKNKTANAIFMYGIKNVLVPTIVERLKICNQYQMKSFQLLYTEKKKRKLELCKLREKAIAWRMYENFLKNNIRHCKKDLECKRSMQAVIVKTAEVHESYFRELVQKSQQYNIGPHEVNTGS